MMYFIKFKICYIYKRLVCAIFTLTFHKYMATGIISTRQQLTQMLLQQQPDDG